MARTEALPKNPSPSELDGLDSWRDELPGHAGHTDGDVWLDNLLCVDPPSPDERTKIVRMLLVSHRVPLVLCPLGRRQLSRRPQRRGDGLRQASRGLQ